MVRSCETCSTPLDEGGACVTCAADAEGLKLIRRSGYDSVREMMMRLEDQGLPAEMEKVPPARPEERLHAMWNLYVPEADVPRALEFLRQDWSNLLGGEDAAVAAARGEAGIDLDAGGEVDCPACGHRFTIAPGGAGECPECGLALGIGANAAPDEAKS